MRFDLHSHSTCSDGLLSPADLVERAVQRGVDVLALTDHDEIKGLADARAAAEHWGLRLIDGRGDFGAVGRGDPAYRRIEYRYRLRAAGGRSEHPSATGGSSAPGAWLKASPLQALKVRWKGHGVTPKIPNW